MINIFIPDEVAFLTVKTMAWTGICLIVLGEDGELTLVVVPSHLGGNQVVGDSVLLIGRTHLNLDKVLKTNLILHPRSELDRHDFINTTILLENEFYIIVYAITAGNSNSVASAILLLPCGELVVAYDIIVIRCTGSAKYLRYVVAIFIGSNSVVNTTMASDFQLVDVQVTVIVVCRIGKQLTKFHLLGIGKGSIGRIFKIIK